MTNLKGTVVFNVIGSFIARNPRSYIKKLSDNSSQEVLLTNKPASKIIKDELVLDSLDGMLKKVYLSDEGVSFVKTLKDLGLNVVLVGNIPYDIGQKIIDKIDDSDVEYLFSYKVGFDNTDMNYFDKLSAFIGDDLPTMSVGKDINFDYKFAKKAGWSASLLDISGATDLAYSRINSVMIDILSTKEFKVS